ncbi:MAG: DUF5615 family PIN-like protein [Patulibacter sp.]
MRFLLDECLSARLADELREAGHDVVRIAELGLLGSPDEVVLDVAASEDRILVSADTDFGELLATSGRARPSVILFRRSPVGQAAVLLANLAEVADDLTQGAVVVLTEDRIRIRRLPIG